MSKLNPLNKRWEPWSTDEKALLRRLYPNHHTEWVAEQLGRSYASTRRKANRMRLKKTVTYRRKWLRHKI